jgi:steroid delta-isomerase-like uncharacterized protein
MTQNPSLANSDTGRPAEQMTREEIVAFFARRQAAYDNLDAVALAADYAPDCIVDSPVGGTHQGPAAVQRVLHGFFSAFLDMKVTTESLLIDGNRVALVRNIEGTHIGEFLGLPATGKPFHLTGVFVYEIRDHQIVRERRIYDFTGLLVQIGVLKAKPV